MFKDKTRYAQIQKDRYQIPESEEQNVYIFIKKCDISSSDWWNELFTVSQFKIISIKYKNNCLKLNLYFLS